MTGCPRCGENLPLRPLHGEKGGPVICSFCAGRWQAQQNQKKKEEDRFLRGIGWGKFAAEPTELNLELLEEAIALTHPDRHPPERAEQAHRVTAELLLLKPHVLPAAPPLPPEPAVRYGSSNPKPFPVADTSPADQPKIRRQSYPCEICRPSTPYFCCDSCREIYDKAEREGRERVNAAQRARRRRKRELRPLKTCQGCGEKFKAS